MPDFCDCKQKSVVQAKHQPLQFLNVSTLREYLRYEFQDLVGAACNPPSVLLSSAADPWHQQKQNSEEGQPEQADEEAEEAEDTSAPVAYIPEMSNGQFDFERVLQDFVLLTFLVSSYSQKLRQPGLLIHHGNSANMAY